MKTNEWMNVWKNLIRLSWICENNPDLELLREENQKANVLNEKEKINS